MKYQYDAYISFSDRDNIESEGYEGWVTNFNKFLTSVLTQLLNREPKIVLSSEREAAKKEHGYTTEELLKNTGAFVSVLSDNYIQDEKSLDELELFNKHHQEKIRFFEESEQQEGTGLFKAVKSPIDRAQQPDAIKSLLSFDFFRFDSEQNTFEELVSYFDSSAKKTYWLSLVDLAYHIYYVVSDQERVVDSGRTVYLAETTPDQSPYRNIIKRELESHGFKVLPSSPLNVNSNEIENEIKNYLKQSSLAIHIMGEQYGNHIGVSEYSLPEIQNMVAAEYCEENNKKEAFIPFERLIWISPILNVQDEKQKVYLSQLKKDIDSLSDAEIVQTPLAVFKSIAYNKANQDINNLKRKLAQKANNQKKSVYLVHGKEDLQAVAPLKDWVTKNGLDLIPSIFEGDQFDLVHKHRNNLAQCDGVIIYYAHYNEQWVRIKLRDLIKAPGFGRKSPLDTTAIYMGLEDSNVKELSVDQGLIVIENEGDFKSHLMEEFLNDLLN